VQIEILASKILSDVIQRRPKAMSNSVFFVDVNASIFEGSSMTRLS